MFHPTSEFRLGETLGITTAQAASLFRHGAEEVASHGMTLNVVFEDATRARIDDLVAFTEAIHRHVRIARVVLCDTVGCSLPAAMQRLVAAIRQRIDPAIYLCMHCHNDFGLAVANTLAGVAAGARAVTCTVNGIGERAGNADLAETVAALTHLLGLQHGVEPLALLDLHETVERMTGIHQSPTKAVTGSNVYRHESGIHVDGMLKDERSYEFLPASWVGQRSSYVLGKHSGRVLIRHILRAHGRAHDEETVQQLLQAVKEATARRDKSEHEVAHQLKRTFETSALAGLSTAWLVELADRLARPRGNERGSKEVVRAADAE
jgi:isopropylmalate/homocitrate/citramalate synthase